LVAGPKGRGMLRGSWQNWLALKGFTNGKTFVRIGSRSPKKGLGETIKIRMRKQKGKGGSKGEVKGNGREGFKGWV